MLDLAPGLYFYGELAGRAEEARDFLIRFRDRVLFGSDGFWFDPGFARLPHSSLADNLQRTQRLLDFLATDRELDNPLPYTREEQPRLRGLGLARSREGKRALRAILRDNFRRLFPGNPAPVDPEAAARYAEQTALRVARLAPGGGRPCPLRRLPAAPPHHPGRGVRPDARAAGAGRRHLRPGQHARPAGPVPTRCAGPELAGARGEDLRQPRGGPGRPQYRGDQPVHPRPHPRELGARVLAAGRHLLLEKPLAISLRGARQIGEALAARGGRTLFSVGYEFRCNPAVLLVRELVRSGFTGEVEAFSLHQFRRPFKRDKWRHWIQQRSCSGGLIVEETCHWFDLLRYLSGEEVASLQCQSTDRILPDFDFEDVAHMQGRPQGGGVFQIAHALAGFDFHLTIAVHGRRGLVPTQGASARPPGRRAQRHLRPGGLGRAQPAAGERPEAHLRPGGHRAAQHPGLREALRRVHRAWRDPGGGLRRRPAGPGALAAGPRGRRAGGPSAPRPTSRISRPPPIDAGGTRGAQPSGNSAPADRR